MTLQIPANVRKKAVLLDLSSMDRNDLKLDALQQLDIDWTIHQRMPADDVIAAIADKEIVVSNKVEIGRAEMEQAKALKLICVAATGTNNIDLQAARELGVEVCNVTAYATASVVQYVFTTLLSLQSRLPEYQQAVQQGGWSASEMFCLLDYPFHELQGKNLGIVGYGELGQAVANVAKAFGMNVLVAKRNENDQRENRIALDEMLGQCHVLSLHCPLTAETENLITMRQLALLPDDAILINTARGGVVNEKDLLEALDKKMIAAAVVDVLTIEPPPEDHILLNADGVNQPGSRLIVTPHIAWASVESRQRMIDQVAHNISEFLAGRPRNIVN